MGRKKRAISHGSFEDFTGYGAALDPALSPTANVGECGQGGYDSKPAKPPMKTEHRLSLLVTKRFYRIKLCRAGGGIKAGKHAD